MAEHNDSGPSTVAFRDAVALRQIDEFWMSRALELARAAGAAGEVPVGAVIVARSGAQERGVELAAAGNTRERSHDPCGHAEIAAIRDAARQRADWRLDGCEIFVTLEPCAMCTGALVLARISRCVFAAPDPKGGFCGSLGRLHEHPGLNHRFEVVGGVMEEQSAAELRSFFRSLRSPRPRS